MFFAKALGGAIPVVFGALYMTGFFGSASDSGPADAAAMRAELRKLDDANSAGGKWGPHCDRIRDEMLGLDGDMPTAANAQPSSGIKAIARVHAMDAKLRKAGCDVDAAPGAFSPFDEGNREFREPSNVMGGGGVPDGSQWGDAPTWPDDRDDGGWGKPK